jgi:hypothetical protein
MRLAEINEGADALLDFCGGMPWQRGASCGWCLVPGLASSVSRQLVSISWRQAAQKTWFAR